MGVLGKLSTKTLIHFGSLVMLSTILLCYVVAVSEGHVEAWLPTISACGERPPEQFFFRYGILTGALLLVVLALYIYTADFTFSRDPTSLDFGVISGLALGVVAVCAANENNTVHTTSAVVFFVLEDFLLVRITLQSHSNSLSKLSVTIKTVCTILAWLSSIGRFLMLLDYLPDEVHTGTSFDIPILAIAEWTNTLAILAFHWSFAFDFSPSYFIAAWKSDDTAKEKLAETTRPTCSEKTKVAML